MTEYKSMSLKDLRAQAKGRLIGKYPVAFTATLVYLGFELIVSIITGSATESTSQFVITLLISIVVDLLLGVLEYGESYLYIKIIRFKKEISIRDLFYGVKNNTDKAILLRSIYTLTSVVALIPSFIYMMRPDLKPAMNETLLQSLILLFDIALVFIVKLFFGLSFYILVDEPTLSVTAVWKKSISYMKKKKGRLMMIYLTSIPVALLSILAFGIGYIWFSIFFKAMLALFYNDIVSELKGTDPAYIRDDTNPADSSTLDIRL